MTAKPSPPPPSRVFLLTSRALSSAGGFLKVNLWLWPVLAAVVLGGVGWLVISAVERAVRDQIAAELITIREADVAALTMWLKSQQAEAEAIAALPPVIKATRELLASEAAERPEAALLTDPAQADLRKIVGPVVRARGFDGFAVASASLRLLASDHDALIGRTDGANRGEFFQRVLNEDRPRVSLPFPSVLVLADESGRTRAGLPIMLAAAPIRDEGGDVLGALALRIRPEGEFSDILRIARWGRSGETYAFDRDGLLLSQSRFDDQLKQIGLLPDTPDARSLLTVSLRDPGVNMAAGERPALRRADQPLTLMAADAVHGGRGVNVAGYNDYRGVPVVGAWTWLPEHEFGVATEVDVAEAYAPLAILRGTTIGLIALLVLSGAVLFLLGALIGRLRRDVKAARKLGQYTLEYKIGSGGMGVVYRAKHAMLRRPTAVKLLNSKDATEAAVQRFEREVQATSQLRHPNTIAIYDFGRTPDGVFYYAMEYLDGINLEDLVSRHGPLPEGRVIHILRQVCGSLAEAHDAGMIHRDIKPANVIVNRRGGLFDFVKVLDFGLVKSLGRDVNLTSSDVVVGTPLYMAPEAMEHPEKVDRRADVYAVGAVGYFLLTGGPVFEGKSTIEICRKHITETPQRPSERLSRVVASDLEAVIMRCLAKEPSGRPSTVAELADELGRCAAAGSWTPADAEKWWRDHGPVQVQVQVQTDSSPASETAIKATRAMMS